MEHKIIDKKGISEQSSSIKKYFGMALFYATIVPFLVAGCRSFDISKVSVLENMIYILAGIHVPLTAYLFLDPSIRKQMRGNPARYLAIPTFIFAVCLFVFLGNVSGILAHKADVVMYFMMAVLSWHFGKQNIGVYAYYRLSTSAGGVLSIEKKLIYLGAFLGAISVSFLGLSAYQSYSQSAPFDDWIYLSSYVTIFGKYFQYALASFTLLYILRNLSRFDWKSALMFFLCVNYFLPAYLGLDWQRWATFFAASLFTHGIQYLVFLFFHSYNARHTIPVPKKWFSVMPIVRNLYVIIFLIIMLTFFASYAFMHTSIVTLEFSGKTSDAYMGSLLDALAVGILLTHFWLDSFFWKFSNKESRDWMLERYNFLFKST